MKLKKILSPFILFILIFGVLLCGCMEKTSSSTQNTKETTYASNEESTKFIVITDLRGKEVKIPANASRYVCLFPMALPFFYIIHAQNGLVGYPGFGAKKDPYFSGNLILKVDPDFKKRCADVGYPGNPNIETILATKSDFVVNMYAAKSCSMIEKKRIPVIGVAGSFGNMGELLKSVEILGKATNHEKDAKMFIDYYKSRINCVNRTKNVKERPKVLYLSYQGPYGNKLTSGGKFNTLVHDIITKAGGIDVAENVTGQFGQISIEDILKWNPDIILIGSGGTKEYIYSNEKLKDINAVKNRRVYIVPYDGKVRYSTWYAPEKSSLGLLWTAKLLHPDKFKDLNITYEAEYYYKTFWGLELGKDIKIYGDFPWKNQ
ncbi:ABC transporter substrate-binding protein [Methanotorris formicicus]|uniref:Periplasmic binding protein n=1 Tax=Methanotorris formicicus Mc-S-70 TaxID=647171 RepID=H1KWW1_9EURY|nr:ABC transporter substrate-binding protein [Methanotorris formicicus]EHP89094.1 periplasmic binding protein [Methanotorris formicicus Mc-S-70]